MGEVLTYGGRDLAADARAGDLELSGLSPPQRDVAAPGPPGPNNGSEAGDPVAGEGLVEIGGLEPPTSALRTLRSPN